MLALLQDQNVNSQGLDNQYIYVFDPTIGDIGTTVTVDISTNTITNPVPTSSSANKYLQPQQAFFVKTTALNPMLTFTEDVKDNTEDQTAIFAENNDIAAVIDQ